MTKITNARRFDRWCGRASRGASALAGLAILVLPLLPAELPIRRTPALVAPPLPAGTTTATPVKNAPAARAAATAQPTLPPPTRPVRTPEAAKAGDPPAPSAVEPKAVPHATTQAASYPAPVARPITTVVASPEARPAMPAAAVAPTLPGGTSASGSVKAAASSSLPSGGGATPAPPPLGIAAAQPRSRPPPHLVEPPAVADPSVPSPAAPLPPESWTEPEIATAAEECRALLGPLDAEVEHVAPFRAGLCGAPAPVMLRRLGISQKVDVQPAALTNCRVVAGLSDWVEETLQPAAREAFGSPVVRIVGASSYVCRNRYNKPDERISEHAFANAIDIAGFVLADGRRIDVKTAWGPTARDARAAAKALAEAARQDKPGKSVAEAHPPPTPPIATAVSRPAKAALEQRTAWTSNGPQRLGAPPPKDQLPVMPTTSASPASASPAHAAATAQSRFLHRLHVGACQIFGTVLGPEANEAHRDHFHLDMKERRRTALCE